LDQGALLSPLLGKIVTLAYCVHAFAHDGRHLFAGHCR